MQPLPAVRAGLLTKLNLLTVCLIVVAVVATSGFYLSTERNAEDHELREHGRTVAALLARLAQSGLNLADATRSEAALNELASETDIGFVSIHDSERRLLVERRFGGSLAGVTLPPLTFASGGLGPASPLMSDRLIAGQRYVEIVTAIDDSTVPMMQLAGKRYASDAGPSLSATPKYIRVGMSFSRTEARFQAQVLRALVVISLLLMVTVLGTMLVTRRLLAPIQDLIGAAKAVAGGKLDVQLPVKSSDELGLLAHMFNRMMSRLAGTQAELINHQRTLEEKVAQRTEELQIATAHAYKIAQHDILTGLPNRSLLNQRLWQILAHAERDHHHIACLFLDFDQFKRINDTLGHDAGDQLLQSLAERLTGAVREADTVARLGGDEFVVVLPGLDPAHANEETLAVLSRIRGSFLMPFNVADQMPTLTCSIGVSMYPKDATDAISLIKHADTAMYAAKENGRNAYCFYTADMNARVQQRLQLETDMRRGLSAGEFFLMYQPKIDMRTGRPCAVEALLRWRHPVRGMIEPAEFIPVAEESGMIIALGEQVLRDACRQCAHWHKQGMPLRVSVNLSVHQLQHESWIAMLTDAVRAAGLKPPYLDLEITESVIITDPEKAVATLVDLQRLGVSVTIDDFGTGYSSLSYLARLPIQGVKIDQRFVSGIEKNKSDAMITLAIIALSHSLGLRVIAEGVGSAAQFDFLHRHGCNEAQGYFLSGPLMPAELRTWWQARSYEIATN